MSWIYGESGRLMYGADGTLTLPESILAKKWIAFRVTYYFGVTETISGVQGWSHGELAKRADGDYGSWYQTENSSGLWLSGIQRDLVNLADPNVPYTTFSVGILYYNLTKLWSIEYNPETRELSFSSVGITAPTSTQLPNIYNLYVVGV